MKLLAVCLAGALASCSSTPQTTKVPMSASLRPDSSLSGQVFNEVNTYRNQNGSGQLRRHPGLDRLAEKHSQYLLANRGKFSVHGKNVSHIGFEGRALAARQAFRMNSVSENVASATKASAKQLVGMWAGSRNHNHNMKNDWNYTGIGIAVADDGTVFATQLFGTSPSSSHMEMSDRFMRR